MSLNRFVEMLEEILDYQWEDFSAETIERTKSIILDTALATIDGLNNKEMQNLMKQVSSPQYDQHYCIPVLGTALYTSLEDNLLLHGTAVVSNENDEGNQFAKGHPAAHIFAPLYVKAILDEANGKDFIRAFILGYEAASRYAYAANMDDSFHPHGTWGIIGGAVACGILQGKTKEEIIEIALLAAATPIATAWEAAVSGNTVRNLYTGIAMMIAYKTVLFQTANFKSSLKVVQATWDHLMLKDFNDELFQKDLMKPAMIEKSFFKYYPSCRFTHSAIDALYQILEKNEIDPNEIKNITVETYGLAARLDNQCPENILSSKFSIPYVLAVILSGENLYGSFTDETLVYSKITEISDKIQVMEDPLMSARLPEERAARVTIEFINNNCLVGEVKDASGSFKEPLSDEKLNQKYLNIIPDQKELDLLKSKFYSIDQEENMNEWFNYLKGVTVY
ncbi:MmgE/PrpD family protein [Niallia nealsonii]|uniref:2-methylcitrate dehydratase n=1 Tax=Niallia nealsonii TaxID=115979 RepID=A0A2N0Z5I1_9BACI|nr:MmgE/PrpD family protein [Niallia nealsonii]PKG24768.1 hypothetical protein CWS01_05845 [Niallia nealsonii]